MSREKRQKEEDNAFKKHKREVTADREADISFRIIEEVKRCVCRIKLPKNKKRGTGFFGVLDSGEETHRGLFTCNHVIDEDFLESDVQCLVENDEYSEELQVKGFWFTDDDLDATFIELTDRQFSKFKNANFRFLHMDYSIKQGDEIFLLQHPRGGDLKFAQGMTEIDKRNGHMFYHNCGTDRGSSGSPITNRDGAVLGIHCGVDSGERKYAVKIKSVKKAIMRVRLLPPRMRLMSFLR
jgi:hypothetical protein